MSKAPEQKPIYHCPFHKMQLTLEHEQEGAWRCPAGCLVFRPDEHMEEDWYADDDEARDFRSGRQLWQDEQRVKRRLIVKRSGGNRKRRKRGAVTPTPRPWYRRERGA